MKKEVCLMCIVCFFLGYFVADVVSKCGFGREHLAGGRGFVPVDGNDGWMEHMVNCNAHPNHPTCPPPIPGKDKLTDAGWTGQGGGKCPFANGIGC